MTTFFYIIFIVYLLAINAYGVLNLNFQRNELETENKISNLKLILAGVLGGALGIYVFMFIFRYKLNSLLMMILMPILIAVNVFIIVLLFRNNFWLYRKTNKALVSLLVM